MVFEGVYPKESVSVSSDPLSFIEDGANTTVTKDNITPSNNAPLPVEINGIDGGIGANEIDSGSPMKVGGVYNNTLPTYDDTDRTNLQSDANGRVLVSERRIEEQNAIDNEVDSGNPIKVGSVYNNLSQTYDDGDRADLQSDINGRILITERRIEEQNSVANSADNGNPIKVGGVYNNALPTYDDGDRTNLQTDSEGRILVKNHSSVADNAADSENPIKVGSKYNLLQQNYDDGDKADLQCDANGRILITERRIEQQNAVDNGPDVGNPIKVGGVYNATPQTYNDGDRANLQLDINGRLLTDDKFLTVVDIMDTKLLDSSITLIPRSSLNAISIVASLASNIKKVQVFNDIGAYMALYDDAARTNLLCVLPLVSGEVELKRNSGTALFLGHLEDTDITSGKITMNFLG